MPGNLRPPGRPYVVRGEVATIRSRSGPDVAPYFARLLRAEHDLLQELLGPESPEKVTVEVHADPGEFRRHTIALGVGPATRGVWDPEKRVIHLSLATVRGEASDPRSVLLHEYVHFYLDVCFGMDVPEDLRARGWPARLPSVPWWLHEGLATQMETTWRDDRRWAVRNLARQRELVGLLRAGRCPSIPSVLGKPPSAVGRSGEYAVAWGLAQALLHAPDPALRRSRRRALREYLSACARGLPRRFGGDPVEGIMRRDVDPGRGFGRWMEHVAARSPELFEELIAGRGRSSAEWERAWRKEMLRLSRPPAR